MNPFILLHGAFGAWDETILLVLVGGFLLSLVWSILVKRMNRKHDQQGDQQDDQRSDQ